MAVTQCPLEGFVGPELGVSSSHSPMAGKNITLSYIRFLKIYRSDGII